MADEVAVDEALDEIDEIDAETQLEEIAPDPWAEPAELDEDVDQFEREYVEKVRQQAADYRTRAKEYADAVGDIPLTDVKTAAELLAGLQTEPGVIKMFYDTGRALGLTPKQMEALFESDDATKEPAEPVHDETDDEVLTAGEMRKALADLTKQLADERSNLTTEGMKQAASNALTAGFADLKVTDETEKAEIMLYGEKHLPPGVPIPSPQQVDDALRKGYDDWNKAVELRVTNYLAAKRAARDAAPKPLGEAGGAGLEQEERPKLKLAEVIANRRAAEKAARQ